MFCKYCGHPLSGTKCPACGKETILVQYSTELDKLISSGIRRTPEKTYHQGIEEGYQRGLSDGYKNGLNDGQASQTNAPITNTSVRTINKKLFVAICAFVFIFGSIASWIISSKIYYKSGQIEGEKTARDAAEQYYTGLLDDKYWEGFSDGEATVKEEAKNVNPTSEPEVTSTQLSIDTSTLFSGHYEVICSRTVNNGYPSKVVKDVQSKLIALGFLYGEDDGKFGPKTEEAVKVFQKDNNLLETGEVDKTTYRLLLGDSVTLEGDSQELESSDETDRNNLDAPTETPNANDVTSTLDTTENNIDNSETPSPSSIPVGYFPELLFPTYTPSAEGESIA